MADYMIHETTLRGIADAIRSKTGNTSLIPVSAMAEQITELSTGGGSSKDVNYVTFMSHDGQLLLGVKPVAVGDNCADPIVRGLFAVPTKESTIQYDFNHIGWADMPNGARNEQILNAITEDKTVYAAYSAVVRTYTARFFDGSTLMATAKAAYGTKATPPDVTKEGYAFDGWTLADGTPADLTVTGDTDFYGKWSLLSALFYVTTVSRSVSDVDINRDGTRMIVGLNNSEMTSPVVYDLTGEEPVQLSTPIHSGAPIYGSACSYDHTGNYFYLRGNYSGNGRINVYHASNSALYTWGQPGTGSYMRCSPVADILAVNGGAYNKYTAGIHSTTSLSNLRSTSFKSADGGAYYYSFSCDGVYIAVGYYNGTVTIHKVSDGSLVKNLGLDNVKWVSYNGDGSKLAVSFSAAPWAAVYDTTTGEKLYDFSDLFSAESRAEYLIGTNLLVAGSGTTVKAFDTSGSVPQEIDGTPTYAGSNISLIKSNQSGTRIAIYGGGVTEIWGKAK